MKCIFFQGIPTRFFKMTSDKKFIKGLLKDDTDPIKILAPLTDNSNAPDEDGIIPIHWAVRNQ